MQVVQEAFGMLHARFAVCRVPVTDDHAFLCKAVTVCCAVHNLCLRLSGPGGSRWLRIQRPTGHMIDSEASKSVKDTAKNIRQVLVDWCTDNEDIEI
jgi:hypothetical protein